jgi:hypothetical protein
MRGKLFCWLLATLLTEALVGQTTNSIILGVVSDSSGAVVPGAAVKVVHEETGVTRDLVTDDTGLYQALSLPLGHYSITISAVGLQRTSYTGIALQVQQTVRFDVSLKVSQQAETVTVEASAPLLDQDSAAVGAVIDNSRLIEMPLNGRNFNQLSLLSPGVVQFYSGGGAVGFGGQLSIGISTNGSRFKDQNYLIDGMSNYNTFLYSTGIDVSLDMIQEFRLQTATYSAEYGLGGGSVVWPSSPERTHFTGRLSNISETHILRHVTSFRLLPRSFVATNSVERLAVLSFAIGPSSSLATKV